MSGATLATVDPASVDPASAEDLPKGIALHMGVAEQGKVHALAGEHETALLYYRKAMQMTVEAEDPEVFFRHYLECVVESLEQVEAWDEVLEYCDKAIALYAERTVEDDLHRRDLAHLHQRRGIVLLKAGRRDEAKEALAMASPRDGPSMPLAETLRRWLEMGLQMDVGRVVEEQRRAGYYAVREESVDRRRAIVLPAGVLGGPGIASGHG